MKLSEILELVRAGYTKEEIAQMDDDQQDNQHNDQQQDNQQNIQQDAYGTGNPPYQPPQQNIQQDAYGTGNPPYQPPQQTTALQQDDRQQDNQTVDQRFAAINDTLDKMVQAMQRMAIRDSKQPDAGKGRTPEQVLEDVEKLYN